MEVPKNVVLLPIFIGEADRWNHRPLYEAIVIKAREHAPGWGHCAPRTDGLWQIESNAYGKDSAVVHGSAGGHRNRRYRGKD